jgi:hypothetical protein
MITIFPVTPSAEVGLVEAALWRLIDEHGRDLHTGDLPLIGGLYGCARQGFPLKPEHLAKISQVRGYLARRYHHAHGETDDVREDWGGAA